MISWFVIRSSLDCRPKMKKAPSGSSGSGTISITAADVHVQPRQHRTSSIDRRHRSNPNRASQHCHGHPSLPPQGGGHKGRPAHLGSDGERQTSSLTVGRLSNLAGFFERSRSISYLSWPLSCQPKGLF